MSWLLVLGAKSDIARACAHEFAGHGFKIILAGRNQKELMDDAHDINLRFGVETLAVEFDAVKFDTHEKFYESLPEGVDSVICAVGYMPDQKESENNPKIARQVIDSNFTGLVSILNIVANDFEKKQSGFIAGISSVAGDRGRKSNYIYGSAKAGFTAYLSGLRHRLFSHGVQVCTVKPGFVNTRMTADLDLNPLLTATPEKVARDIYRAYKKKTDVLYTKWMWRYIMLIIKHLPEFLFKRTNM